MNLSEAHKLVAILKGVYLREKFTEESPVSYHWLLEDVPYDEALRAAKIHGMRSQWCPTPAELRAILADEAVSPISPGEAMALVQKQINKHSHSGWEHVTFDDPAIMEAVKTVGWKRICLEDRSKGDYVLRDFEAALKTAQQRQRRDIQDGTAIGAGNVTAIDRRAS